MKVGQSDCFSFLTKILIFLFLIAEEKFQQFPDYLHSKYQI